MLICYMSFLFSGSYIYVTYLIRELLLLDFFFFTKRRWLLTSKWVTIMSNIIVKILFLSAKLSTFVFSSVSKNINQSFRNSFGSFFVWYLCLTFLNGSQWLLGRLLNSIYHVRPSRTGPQPLLSYYIVFIISFTSFFTSIKSSFSVYSCNTTWVQKRLF